jgi:hypothetical protein
MTGVAILAEAPGAEKTNFSSGKRFAGKAEYHTDSVFDVDLFHS